jgi:hypothetical protein
MAKWYSRRRKHGSSPMMACMDMNGIDGAMENCRTIGSSYIADGNRVETADAVGARYAHDVIR